MQVIRKIMKKHNRETLPLSNEQLMDALYRAKRLLGLAIVIAEVESI